MKSRLFKRAYLFASSPKLTLAILVYSTFLLFGATLMQSQIGIAEMQGRYVESFIFLASPFFWSSSFLSAIKFPLFGGAFVGTLAVVNLIASCMRYAKFGIQGFGVSITHMAIVLLIISGALQYFMRVEGRISLREGVPANLVYIGSGSKTITLPFSVTLKQFKDEKWAGSDIAKEYSSQIYFERGGSRRPKLRKEKGEKASAREESGPKAFKGKISLPQRGSSPLRCGRARLREARRRRS